MSPSQLGNVLRILSERVPLQMISKSQLSVGKSNIVNEIARSNAEACVLPPGNANSCIDSSQVMSLRTQLNSLRQSIYIKPEVVPRRDADTKLVEARFNNLLNYNSVNKIQNLAQSIAGKVNSSSSIIPINFAELYLGNSVCIRRESTTL